MNRTVSSLNGLRDRFRHGSFMRQPLPRLTPAAAAEASKLNPLDHTTRIFNAIVSSIVGAVLLSSEPLAGSNSL